MQDEMKEIRTTSTVVFADHLLTMSEQTNYWIREIIDDLRMVVNPPQAFILSQIPVFQAVTQVSGLDKVAHDALLLAIADLEDEVGSLPDEFYPPLASRLYTNVIKAVGVAIGKSSSVQQRLFFSQMMDSLSKIDLVSDQQILPKRLLDKIKSFGKKKAEVNHNDF